MGPVLLIGRYLYSHWVLGARPGGIESYRSLPQLGVPPCDRGNVSGSLWLLRFVTVPIGKLTSYLSFFVEVDLKIGSAKR